MDAKEQTGDYPKFSSLVKFVSRQAEEAVDPVYGSWNVPSNPAKSSSEKKQHTSSFAANAEPKKKSPCILCSEEHRLLWCPRFKAMKPMERLQYVESKKLCHNCLLSNHVVKDCRKPSVCSVPGCGQRHTKFIHIDKKNTGQSITMASGTKATGKQVCMPLVEVVVDNKCPVLALLDTGSNTTFCTRRLVNALGKCGSSTTYSVKTISSKDVRKTQLVELEITSRLCSTKMKLENVYVVDDIPVDNPVVDDLVCSHLQDLPIVVNGSVDLLVGLDHAEALIPLEVRKGKTGDPFAVRTVFGWSVNGPLRSSGSVSKQVITNFVTSDHLAQDIQNLWSVEHENVPRDKMGMSVEDAFVLNLWESDS
jgi:hypothetical protein